MKLSRKKAIRLCIELWEWCARTGKLKSCWPDWDKYGGNIFGNCWFCEYDERQKDRYKGHSCFYCPFVRKLGLRCKDTYYTKWDNAKTPRTRKKYAKLFLEQIKKCI